MDSEPNLLRNIIFRVITRCLELKGEGHWMNPGNVMDRIEDVFCKLDMIEGSMKSNFVKILIKDHLTTRMTNHYLGLICELNPNQVDLVGMPRQYDMWIFFRYNNKDLMRDMASGTFVFPW